jgi:enterochelin esterase family protein
VTSKSHLKAFGVLAASLCLITWIAGPGSAQNPVPLATTGLVSPEVHSDRTVTFRIQAPKAAKVQVAGEWMSSNHAETTTDGSLMKKDDKGVWTTTIGPLEPNTYTYSFDVDGMNIADPVNPIMKLRARTSASMVTIPGNQPWEFREVPHGNVTINYHKAAALNGAVRQVFVYTPPGYEKSPATRYPVLYLLHGSGGVASDWTQAGFANYIEDNLVADKKAVPMIIVMTFGHAIPIDAPTPTDPALSNNSLFEQYLLKDVIPMVESRYRVAPGRTNRAIAGLSMGGSQATQIGYGHPDLFASVGIFSSTGPADAETKYKVFADAKTANTEMKALFFGVGKEDTNPNAALKKVSASLTSRGIKNVFFEDTEGATGHVWAVWRKCLVQFVPLLFQNAHSAGA